MTAFAAPAAGGDSLPIAEMVDHIVVFDVLAQEQNVETDYGPKDPVRATVHDVTAGETYEDALIFQGYLIGALKRRIGQKVLGRIYLGDAKKGQKPPYMIEDASGDSNAVSKATAYLEAYAKGQFAAPGDDSSSEQADDPLAALDPEARAAVEALMAKKG